MTPLDFSLTTLAMALLAGLTSIASPCVLPVVPIIVTGTDEDHRFRPLLIVGGLSISFMTMGALTSIFGGAVAKFMPLLEKGAGIVVILFGILMLLGVNMFKGMTFFQQLNSTSKGRWSGLVLGLTLGLVWIPCVGPMLSGVLALVATKGKLLYGLVLLGIYSLGFSIPMLLAGYASQTFRQRTRLLVAHPMVIRLLSGLLLIGFGIYILTAGMLAIGFSS
jgi:cytochrome c-type biogenesis protein